MTTITHAAGPESVPTTAPPAASRKWNHWFRRGATDQVDRNVLRLEISVRDPLELKEPSRIGRTLLASTMLPAGSVVRVGFESRPITPATLTAWADAHSEGLQAVQDLVNKRAEWWAQKAGKPGMLREHVAIVEIGLPDAPPDALENAAGRLADLLRHCGIETVAASLQQQPSDRGMPHKSFFSPAYGEACCFLPEMLQAGGSSTRRLRAKDDGAFLELTDVLLRADQELSGPYRVWTSMATMDYADAAKALSRRSLFPRRHEKVSRERSEGLRTAIEHGDALARAAVFVAAEHPDPQVRERERQILVTLANSVSGLWHGPSHADDRLRQDASRWPLVTLTEITHWLVLPHHGIGARPGRAGVLLQNVGGEPVVFNPFESDGDNNTIIAGGSGAGKDYIAKSLALSLLGGQRAATVAIIDNEEAYASFADALDGRRVKLSPTDGAGLNPLALIRSARDLEDNADLLARWVLLAADMKYPSDYCRVRTHEAIVQASRLWGYDGLTLERIARTMLDLGRGDLRVEDLAAALHAFRDKPGGHAFIGECNAAITDGDGKLTVFDTTAWRGNPGAEKLILTTLALLLRIHWHQVPVCTRPKLLIAPQALAEHASSADDDDAMVGDIIRGMRMIHAGVAITTNSLAEISPAVLNHSSHLVLLQAGIHNDYEAMKWRLKPEVIERLRYLATTRRWSELMWINNGWAQWLRLVADPATDEILRHREPTQS